MKDKADDFKKRGIEKMIKVSVLYPGIPSSTFDMDYYLNQHIPMVRAKLGMACKSAAVEQGLGCAAPGSPPAFSAMGHLYFESVEAFQAAFGRLTRLSAGGWQTLNHHGYTQLSYTSRIESFTFSKREATPHVVS